MPVKSGSIPAAATNACDKPKIGVCQMPIFAQLRSVVWIVGGFAVAVLIIAWQVELRHARKLSERVVVLTQLRAADRQSYEAAQAQAKANNQAQVQKIEAQNEAITNRVRSDYQRDLDRLRGQARANRGAAGRAPISGVPQAAPGVDADGLPDAPCDHLCASEIELRLLYLQRWVAEQVGVTP